MAAEDSALAFHVELQELRQAAGNPSFNDMSSLVGVPESTLRRWFAGAVVMPQSPQRQDSLILMLEEAAVQRGAYVKRGLGYWQKKRQDDAAKGVGNDPLLAVSADAPLIADWADPVQASARSSRFNWSTGRWDAATALAFVALVVAVFQILDGPKAVLICAASGIALVCGIIAQHHSAAMVRIAAKGGYLALVFVTVLLLVIFRSPAGEHVAGGSSTSQQSGQPSAPVPVCGDAGGLVVVVGVHQNMPAAGVSMELSCIVDRVTKRSGRLGVIAVDGTPELVLDEQLAPDSVNALIQATRTPADSPGSDLAKGLELAAEYAIRFKMPDPRIVVLDSGLPDRGVIDMTKPGVLEADPATFARQLSAQFDPSIFDDVSVDFVGFGLVSAPQAPLGLERTTALVEIWKSLFISLGANVSIHRVFGGGAGPSTPFKTRTVPVT
jgi:hypothetical protein